MQECKRTKIAAKKVFGKYGLHFEEDVTKPLGLLTPQHAMTQVATWILLHLEQGESTEIRLTNPTTKDVYTVVIEHTIRVPQGQWCISKIFSLQHTSVRLPAFQDTQATSGEFVER